MFRDPQVNAYVCDVEACVRFYTESLGFVETFRTPESGPPAHVEVRLGGLILGVMENYGQVLFGTGWRDVVAFVLLILILMFRPTGILGESLGRARV